jgi:hypothetical protein
MLCHPPEWILHFCCRRILYHLKWKFFLPLYAIEGGNSLYLSFVYVFKEVIQTFSPFLYPYHLMIHGTKGFPRICLREKLGGSASY